MLDFPVLLCLGHSRPFKIMEFSVFLFDFPVFLFHAHLKISDFPEFLCLGHLKILEFPVFLCYARQQMLVFPVFLCIGWYGVRIGAPLPPPGTPFCPRDLPYRSPCGRQNQNQSLPGPPARRSGAEKRSASLAWEGSPLSANPLFVCVRQPLVSLSGLIKAHPTLKGPFCTKNSTALESIVYCYRRSFPHSVPLSCLFCLEKPVFLSPLRSVLLRPYRIFSPYRNSVSVVLLVREGPLGNLDGPIRANRFADSRGSLDLRMSQARKRHMNINFLVRLPLGRPPVCPTNPWDKPGMSLG